MEQLRAITPTDAGGFAIDQSERVTRMILLQEPAWLVEAPPGSPPTVAHGRQLVYSSRASNITFTAERGGTLLFQFQTTQAEMRDWNHSSTKKSARTAHLQVINSFLLFLRDAEIQSSSTHIDLQRVTSEDWVIDSSPHRYRGIPSFDRIEEAERYANTKRVIGRITLDLAVNQLDIVMSHPEGNDLIEVVDLVSESNMAQELDNSTTALVSSWTAIEYLIRRKWTAEHGGTSQGQTAAVIAANLRVIGYLSEEEFDSPDRVRVARNAWLHEKRRPSWWDAEYGVHLARTLVAKEFGFPPPPAGSWHRPIPL